MIGTERSPQARPANAFYPGGTWEYRRTLPGPDPGTDACVVLDFEGVYRDAVVSVNGSITARRPSGSITARRPSGYSRFSIPIGHQLLPGDNEVRVDASAHEDSRWYSGAGTHRDVWLLESGSVHLSPDGLAVRTPEIDDGAVVVVRTVVENESTATNRSILRVQLFDADRELVATDDAPVTSFPERSATLRQRLFVHRPRRWRLDDPPRTTRR